MTEGSQDPLSISGTIAIGWRMWTANAGRLALIVAVFVVPAEVLLFAVHLLSFPSGAVIVRGQVDVPDYDTVSVLPALIMYLLGLFASLVANGAVCRVALGSYYGLDASSTGAIASMVRRLGGLLLLQISIAVLVGIGFVFLVIPGIFLVVMLLPALPVFVVERTSAFGAIARSSELVDGRWWATAGRLLAGTIPIGVLGGAIDIGLTNVIAHTSSAAVLYGGRAILSCVVGIVFGPPWICLLSAVYADLRAREGPLEFAHD